MSDPLEQLTATLKQNEQNLTAARKIVFGAMLGQEAMSMNDLVRACEGLINRASIYRVVALYERLGIVKRLQIGWKYKLELSDAFQEHHHHLTCLRCGLTISLEADIHLEKHLSDAAAAHGFVMQEHQLEIQGLCKHCSAVQATA